MTREKLSKATELSRHIHYTKEDLKDIKYYEDTYSDCPFQLKLKRTSNGVCDHFKDVFDENAELEKENAELKKQLETAKEMCCGKVFCPYRSEISLSEVKK